MNHKVTNAALIVAVFLTGTLLAQQPQTLLQRVCGYLRIDPDLYEKLTAVRGRPHFGGVGRRVMVGDLDRQKFQELWECGGCWSPITLGKDQVAVIKSDGIWTLGKTPGTPKLEIPGQNLARLISALPGRRRRALVLVTGSNDIAPLYTAFIADFDTRTLEPPPASLSGKYRETELSGFPRPDQLLRLEASGASPQGKWLSTSISRPRHLLMATVALSGEASASENTEALPWLGNSDSTVERFDPIWLSSRQILYLQSP